MSSTIDTIESPKRPAFTDEQLVQAKYIGGVTEQHYARRRTSVTHAIDNVTPEIVADRDDGIMVEVQPAGRGYHVHVTIADVAAHVRPDSPLATAAWQRAFTVYKPGSIDSMFPKILEQTLSLEHGKERLGLAVNITLDEHFKPVHTSFAPVITKPDNASYDQAKKRIESDPQFGLMARIAQGIQQRYASNNVAWEELLEDRRMRRGLSDSEIKTMKMVATYMLLANNCVAEFFSASELPFLYRNFDGSQDDARASYGTQALGHTALESEGLRGAYCHFTSPIRRAPDYFNGVMAHYAINVLTNIEERIVRACPGVNATILNDQLWQHGPQILKLIAPSPDNQKPLIDLLSAIASKALATPPASTAVHNVLKRSITTIVNTLELPQVPLTTLQLDKYAARMNALAHSPEMTQINRLNEKLDDSTDIIKNFADMSAEDLEQLPASNFSRILKAAALTGEMPDMLFKETKRRIEQNTLTTRDLTAIFIQVQYPFSARWKELKGDVANLLKKEPGTVNTLLTNLGYSEKNVEHRYWVTPTMHDQGRGSRICNALLVRTNEDGSQDAAPFVSIGHNERAARSYARYSFLEYYAFGQLLSVEQTATPNLLYADLNLPDAKKLELFKLAVKDSGATADFHTRPITSGYRATITVKGGEIFVPITTYAEEKTEELATKTALGRMLRHDAFRLAMSRNEVDQKHLLNPQDVLAEELKQCGGSVTFPPILSLGTKSNAGFLAAVTMHLPDSTETNKYTETTYTAIAPNKDSALRIAAGKALAAFWGPDFPASPPGVRGWAFQENVRLPSDNAQAPP